MKAIVVAILVVVGLSASALAQSDPAAPLTDETLAAIFTDALQNAESFELDETSFGVTDSGPEMSSLGPAVAVTVYNLILKTGFLGWLGIEVIKWGIDTFDTIKNGIDRILGLVPDENRELGRTLLTSCSLEAVQHYNGDARLIFYCPNPLPS